MNDEELERQLRDLPLSLLPEAWRREILSTALREARVSKPSPQVSPVFVVYLRNLFMRNPVTGSALTALWILIFVFRFSTPADPASEKMLAVHLDSNRPIYIVSISQEIELAQLWQDQPDHQQIP